MQENPRTRQSPTTPGGILPAWRVGDVLSEQYEIKGVLGEGGMGRVYLVHHREWNVDLAVKSPRPELFTRANDKMAFMSEAETWVNLDLHPHIVECYYVRVIDTIPRIFAEYVDGGSLANWIRDRRLYDGGPQSALDRILDIAIQFAWGLDAAHAQGLVHQDIKPANVMLTSGGIAKVTDFGLARTRTGTLQDQTATADVPSLNQGGTQSILVSVRGMTPAYCSPEQAAGQVLSRRTDIWSWAVSVLEMFTGGVTWLSGVLAGEVLSLLEEDGPDNAFIPALPPELADLLRRCLTLRPEQRPASMAEVASELCALYARATGTVYPRKEPVLAEVLANSLNNRALSLYDLGKREEAHATWNRAIQLDHLLSHYNAGIASWNESTLTDDALLASFRLACERHTKDRLAPLLLASIQLSRGALDEALPLLESAVQGDPEQKEAYDLLEQAKSGAISATKRLRALTTETLAHLSLSENGRFALTTGPETSVQVWNTESGLCLQRLPGHTGMVNNVCISGDGRLGLSSSYDGTVRVWDLPQGHCLYILSHTAKVTHVCLSLDGKRALSASEDEMIHMWDIERGERVSMLNIPHVHDMSLNGDGQYAVTISAPGIIQIWDVAQRRCLHTLEGHADKGVGPSSNPRAAISEDGRLIVSGAQDAILRVWDAQSGRCLREIHGHSGPVTTLSLSSDGRLALSSSYDKTVRLWEVESGICLHTFLDPEIRALPARLSLLKATLSPDGTRALYNGFHTETQVWQIARQRFMAPPRFSQLLSYRESVHIRTQVQQWVAQAEAAYRKGELTLALDLLTRIRSQPDYMHEETVERLLTDLRRFCARGGWRGCSLRTTLVESRPRTRGPGNVLNFLDSQELFWALAVSEDSRIAITGREDRLMTVWDVEQRSSMLVLPGHTAAASSVCISPDGTKALSASHDTTLRLWDIATGQSIRVFQGHQLPVYAVAMSADGLLALSGGADASLRLWEVETGRCLRVLEGHQDWIFTVSLSADGLLALSGGRDGVPHLWNMETGNFQLLARGDVELNYEVQRKGSLYAAQLSPDGTLALTGGTDGCLTLWGIKAGGLHSIKTASSGTVRAICLSPDKRVAVTASDGGIDIWDLQTRRCLQTLPGHSRGTRAIALSDDLRQLVSYGCDENLLQWELNWELEVRAPVDWDAGAEPLLQTFLATHIALDEKRREDETQQGLIRRGRPVWTEPDFQVLLARLQRAGYGWLRPEGVRARLQQITTW